MAPYPFSPFGKSLADIRQGAFKGEWKPWLDSIQMGRETAVHGIVKGR